MSQTLPNQTPSSQFSLNPIRIGASIANKVADHFLHREEARRERDREIRNSYIKLESSRIQYCSNVTDLLNSCVMMSSMTTNKDPKYRMILKKASKIGCKFAEAIAATRITDNCHERQQLLDHMQAELTKLDQNLVQIIKDTYERHPNLILTEQRLVPQQSIARYMDQLKQLTP